MRAGGGWNWLSSAQLSSVRLLSSATVVLENSFQCSRNASITLDEVTIS
jgi:hypothetical protein